MLRIKQTELEGGSFSLAPFNGRGTFVGLDVLTAAPLVCQQPCHRSSPSLTRAQFPYRGFPLTDQIALKSESNTFKCCFWPEPNNIKSALLLLKHMGLFPFFLLAWISVDSWKG